MRVQGWKLNQALRRIQHSYEVSAATSVQLRRTLWHDMSAEFHAENLCRHLHDLNFEYTPDFLGFLNFWRQDEWKHFSWMAGVYSSAFKTSGSWLKKKLAAENADFSDLQDFFIDEFTILVLFAYDEILTVLSYQSDRTMYAEVDKGLLSDFNKIIADEANHFNNACDILIRQHHHRLAEVPLVLSRLQNWERSKRAYGNTFLLDRRESQVFQTELVAKGCRILSSRLT